MVSPGAVPPSEPTDDYAVGVLDVNNAVDGDVSCATMFLEKVLRFFRLYVRGPDT